MEDVSTSYSPMLSHALPANLDDTWVANTLPPKHLLDMARYFAHDWNLPLHNAQQSTLSSDLCISRAHLPGYNALHLFEELGTLHAHTKAMVVRAFDIDMMHGSWNPDLAFNVYQAVTREPLDQSEQIVIEPHQAALVSRVIDLINSDLFVALTSPILLPQLLTHLKKLIPKAKSDLKLNRTSNWKKRNDLPHYRPSSHFIFNCIESSRRMASTKSIRLINFLESIVHHGMISIGSEFRKFGLEPPQAQLVQELLNHWLDWFLRLKSQYPGLGFYFPKPHEPFDVAFASSVNGYGARSDNVAFTELFGLWDCVSGLPGKPASVWTKLPATN
jgi:hypothetical protein